MIHKEQPLDVSWLEKLVPRGTWTPSRVEATLLTLPDGVLFLDTETTGLYPWKGHRPFLVGLASTEGKTALVRMDNRGVAMAGFDDDWLRELLDNPAVLKVWHNGKFDFKHLHAAGYEVAGQFVDTMLLTQLADSSMASYALKSLAARMGEDVSEEKKVKAWLKRENMRRRRMAKRFEIAFEEANYADVPRALTEEYLRKDLRYTAMVAFSAGPRVARISPAPARVEMGLIRVTAAMEERGVWADGRYFQKMAEKSRAKQAELAEEAQKIARRRFDITSNKQLADAMFKGLGLKCLKYTPKGSPCFDADALPLYDHPLARTVLANRRELKLCSTYYEPLAEMALWTGGTIHSNFNLLGARKTGRMSSSDPNLQNIPRRDKTVRRGFTCRPGFVNYYLDYSQIEMRVAAHYAGDGPLRRAILAGEDLHTQTARLLFGEEAEGNELLRFVGKTINFGILYGMGKRSLRKQLRKKLLDEIAGDTEGKIGPTVRAIADITETGAQSLLAKYRRAYPDIAAFMAANVRELARAGEIKDLYGRVYQVPAQEDYKSTNYLVQGTAAGVLKRAMLRLDRALASGAVFRAGGERCRMVNTVHDEVQVEVPLTVHARGWAAGREMASILEDRHNFELPITVDLAWSDKSWADKVEVELYET